MQIKQAIQTENGEVEFSGNLGEPEVAFLLEYAINNLMRAGALPFVGSDRAGEISVQSMEPQ